MHFVRRYILFRRYKTNSLSFFKRFLRLSFFMSYFIRAAQRFLSVALSFVLAFYPFSVQAAEIKAAQGSVAPTVYQAPNGVAMVDIVAPNSAGVSHNKYEQFNIGPSGVILNNSTAEVSQSRLGGLIGGNRNLNNNETARIILNEVTSSNRSLLQGAAEIHGRSAEFILANPYGITCNGCGFINTPQVTLTSGVPQFNADGSLHGFNVRGGDILFGERGAYLSEADVFNIVTHRVRIDGPLYVGEGSLDIATGPMAWAYNTGLITPYESQTGEDVPSYAIDSSLLGGMYAGRIRLISTQAGAGVRLRGDVASTTDGMMLSADGKLVLNRVQSQKGLDVASHASSVEFHDVAYAQEDVAVDAQTDITLGQAAILASQADVSLDAGSDVRLADGSLIVSGMAADGGRDAQSDIAISATQLESTGTGQVDAADELHITAQKIDISRSADAADGGDGLSSRGDMVLEVNQIEANNNRILSYRDIRLSGLGDIKLVSGTMIAGGDMQITSDASLDNAMSLLAYNALSVETGTVTNTGAIASYGGLSLGSGDAVLNGFENSGQLYAYDSDITIDASDFTNAGGELRSIGTGDITVDAERFTNNSGTVSAAGDLTLTGGEFSNIVDDANSLILSGGDMALSFAGDVFSNAGYLVSSGGFTLIQAGDVTNSGVIQAQGDIGFGSDAAYLSGFSQSGMIKSIDGGVSVYADGFVGDAESQLIAAGDVAISVLGDVDNNGALASFEGDIGFTGAGSWTGDGLIQAGAGGIDINGFDSFGGAARLVGHGDVVIAVNGALSLAEGGFIATQNIVDEAGESILSGEVNLSGNVLSIAGQLTAQGGGVGLTALDGLSLSTTSSVFAASGLDIISGGDFATAGSVQSQGGLSIASSGNITQSGTLISLASDTALSLEAGLLSNTGAIASYGGLSLGSGDTALSGFDNSGQLYAYDSDVDIHASGFTNAGGELRSIGTGDITVDADSFTNNAGTVSAAGDLTLTGREFSNIVDDANSLILSGGNMALSYAGDVFSNAGYLVSSGGFALTQAGDVTNSGVIQAQGDIGFGSDAAYLSGFSQSGMVKSIDGGVSVYAAGFVSDAESQLIGAGDVAISVLGDVDNNGALASFDGDIGFTGAGSWTGDGLIQAVAGGIDINGFDSFGGAARLVGHGDVVIAVNGALSLAEGGFIATQNIVDEAGESILSGGVNLSGEALSIAGQLTAQGGGVGLTASDDLSIFDTSSVFAASGLDIISGGDFATAGRVQSQGGLSIASSGNITQSGTLISLASDSVLSLEAGSLSNTGATASYGGLSLGSGDAVLNGFENSGQLYAYDSDITIDASDFTNAGGELRSIGTGDITVDADSFTNNAGTVSAAGDLTLTGKSLYNYGGYAVDNMPDNSGLIYAGGVLDFNISDDFTNKSYIINSADLNLNLGGAYENHAKIQSGGVLTLQGEGNSYLGGLSTKAGSVLNGIGGLTIKAAGLVNHGAVLSSAGDMHFYLKNGNAGSGTLRNYGAVQSAGSSHFYLEDEFFNSQGSIFAGQNITVEKITNQDAPNGGTIIHGGKINTLLNSSGTIEAGGNIDIYANDISNKRTQFSVTKTSKTLEGKTEIYDEKTSHYEASFCLNVSTIYCVYSKINEDIYWRTVTEVGESLKANYTVEAIIKAGVDLSLNATNTLENKQSSLYAGGTVSITGNSFINQGERVENYTISNYVRENKATESKHTFCFVDCGDQQKINDSGWSWSKTSTSTEDLGSTKNVTRTSQEFEANVRGGKEVKINLTGNLDNKEMGFITSGHIVRVTTNKNITNEGVFWSDGAAYLHLDGTLTNKNGGDIIGDEELTIRGKNGGRSRADAIINQASTIETLAGNLYLYADEVVNDIGLKPVKHKLRDIEYVSNNYMTQVGYNKYYWEDDITYYREKYAINPGEAGKIISGNHLVIEAGYIKNDHSALSAGWQLRANVAIEQSGTELQEWSRTYSKLYVEECGMSLRSFSTWCGSKKYVGTTSSSTPKVSTSDSTTAIISAKNVIIGQDNKSGTIHSVTGSNINMEVVTPEGIEPLNVTTNTKSIDKSDASTDIAGDTDGSIPDTDVDETMFKDGVDVDSEDPSTQIEGDDSASHLDIDTATDTPSVNADELAGAADDIAGDSEASYIDNQTLVSDDYDIDSADMAADDMEVPEPPVFVPPAQNGLFSDIDIPTNNEPAPPGKAVSLSALTNSIDALSRRSLFKTRPEGDTPYQIETRIEFLDASTYYGSDYFIEKYNHDGNESLRRLGDSFAETRLIRAQVQELTGRHTVSADSANEQAMIKTLYDNAYAAQQSLELTPGVSLSAEQVAALQEDIIWLEKQQVNGEEVLVPRVYLADAREIGFATSIYGQENVSITADSYTTTSSDSLVSDGNMFITTVEEFTHEGHLEVANAAVFNVGTDFTNMVDLDAAYIEVNAGGDILNDNAALTSTGGLLLTAGGMMHNLGGQISGSTVSIIAQDILNETEIDREYNGRNNYTDTLGDVASISATGSMSLIAANSITVAGAELTAGGSLLMDANTVTVTALALEEQFSGKRGGWKVNEYQKTLASSSITAGEDLTIHADQNILILGSDLTATGAVGLSTLNGDITIAAMQEVLSQTRKKTTKKSWGRRKTTTETTLDITNQMATITSGAGISFTSGKDINLKAANLNAGQDINLTTLLEEGSVNILVGKDIKQVDRTTTKSNALVEGNRWSGSYDETLVYTEMQTGNGGKVNFNTENINVDYLDPTAKSSSGAQSGGGLQSLIVPLALSEALQRQKAEGQVDDIVAANDNLSWMQDLTGDERVNWTGVEETHTSYSESSKNLTQAGALIVSAIATAATGGLAAGVAGSALSAAASSAAVLGSNAALNSGGSFNDFMDTMTDKDTLQQIATSAVTGAISAGAADWAAGTADSVVGATNSTFMSQAGHYAVEVTTQSAIQAGTDAILSGGDWNDMRDNFTDGFESRLVSNMTSRAISRGDILGNDLGDKVAKASNDFLGRATDVVVDSVTETAVNALVEVGKGGNLSDFGDAFQDNFEDTLLKNTAEAANEAISREIGTQAKVGELTDGEHGIGTATQLGLHALTGCASAALQSGDCGTGALGQVTGEVVGMLYNENTDMADIDGDGSISAAEAAAWKSKGVELAGTVTQAVLTATGADAKDIAIGTTNAKTAAENNALCGGVCVGAAMVAVAAYLTAEGDGNPLDGLGKVGAGEDTVSVAVGEAVEAGVNYGMEHHPEATGAVLGTLSEAADAVDATFSYVDDATGNVVSGNWNELDEETQNRLKGAVGVGSLFIPGASAKILTKTPNTGKLSESETTTVTIPKDKYPESAQHIEDAQAAGHPSTLTVNREGAALNRRNSLRDVETQPGVDRDEYPPAMFEEGGTGASVRYINPSDNRGAGACIGAQCKNLPNGSTVKIVVE